MLAKVFEYATAWFLLSLIVGLLVGRAISTFREAPAPGDDLYLEGDWETVVINEKEVDAEEMPAPAHAEMQGVR
jgi:hypothetical protein